MKRFTLLLVVAMMAVVSFAQAPKSQVANRQLTKEQMVQMRNQKADASKLTAVQKQHAVGMMQNGKMKLNANKHVSPKSKMQVGKKLNQQVARKQTNFNGRKFDAQKIISQKDRFNVKHSAKKNGAAKAPRKADGQTPVTVPDGLETETYVFTGISYRDYANVTFNVEVGFDGNDVYVQGILRSLPAGWIKGVKEGDKITFAKGQYLGDAEISDYYTGESLGFFPATLMYENGQDGSLTDFVLDVNEETGVLDDLAQGALYFDDGNDGTHDVLLNTRLTPLSMLGDISYDLVTPPATAETFGVDISGHSFAMSKQVSNTGMMAIDGNDIYVLGLCPDIAGWVKGTVDANNVVTFAKGQYLGLYRDMFDMWFMGIDPTDPNTPLIDVTAAWNPTERTLTFDENSWIVENADPISLSFADILYDVFVEPMSDDRSLVIPPTGLETQPYKTTVASLGNYEYANGSYTVNIGFDGDDAYMQGLLYFAPSAWLKGTRNADGSITFAKNQYLGTVQGYDVYVVPCSDEVDGIAEIYDSFTFTYDAEKDTYYYIEQNTNLSFSVAPESTDAVEIIFNVVMKGPDAPEEEEINTDVIWDQPEGDLTVYTRAGGAYYSFFGYLVETTQGGTSIKVVTDGNDVYMENPISQGQVEGGTWVKGTLEGNKIHMPLKQCILYDEWSGYGYMTAAFRPELKYDEDYEEEYLNYVMTDDTEVVFTINEDGTITMDHESGVDPETGLADWIYGLAYTDDLAWAQLGDFNSVYTPFNEEIVTIPETLESETWAMMYEDENGYSSARIVNVAVDGDKMYVAGMSADDMEAAIVGTIADGKVTFASDQYIGMNTGYIAYGVFANLTTEYVYDDWYEEYIPMTGFEYLPEYSFTYDAENKIMTSAEDVAFVVNAGKGADEVLYISYAANPRFNYFEEVPAVPADPEFLDYANWFDDYGYDLLVCNIKLEDVNGKYINQDKVYYMIWTKIDGETEPFVFYADEYYGFADYGFDELTELPVNFESFDAEGYQDIAPSGSSICIYQTGFDDYGVQTIYYGGDERNVSNIVWYNDVETGITNATTSAEANAMFDLAGRQVKKLQKGVNIVRLNGKTTKVLVK